MYHSMSRSPLDTFPKNVLPSRAKAKARKSVTKPARGQCTLVYQRTSRKKPLILSVRQRSESQFFSLDGRAV